MHKENTFLKIITLAPLVFIPLIIGIVSVVFITMYNTNFQNNLEKTEENLYAVERKTAQTKVKSTSDIITYRKSILKENLKLRVKQRVELAYDIAQSIYIRNRATASDAEIKNSIKDALGGLIWNEGESFIWIVDYQGIFNLAPKYLKSYQDTSIIDFQDATGRFVIQEEIAICKEKGEGFLWDTFTKPNGDKSTQYKQVAFVKSFAHFDWYLGSAEYLDTARKKSDKNLLVTLKHIDTINSNYIFVINTQGDILMNKSIPQFEGKNISSFDNPLVKSVINHINTSLNNKDSAFIKYKWLNPSNDSIEMKYSFVQKIPNTDWIIGSGFYLSDINNKISKQKIDMYDLMYKKSNSILYIALFVIFISILIAYYLTKNLKAHFATYKKDINTHKNQLLQLNNTLETKVAHRTAELENLKNDFEKLATIDTLTNIHNRYSIMKLFSIEINRSHRYNTPFSIIMLDIDFFKKVNDTYGHAVGDDVLISLSDILQKNLREMDTAGRYGGEEFIILLPNTTLEDAENFSQRLRKNVQEHSFDIVKHITVSLGLVELHTDENIDEVFKRVDDLLYKSKKSGRNRVSY